MRIVDLVLHRCSKIVVSSPVILVESSYSYRYLIEHFKLVTSEDIEINGFI